MEQRRTDRATRRIRAGANRLWQAWIDPAELVRWLPPGGMTGQVLALDPQPDGAFHIRLYYPADAAGHGKTAEGVDDVEGRFVHLDPPRAFRLDVTFRSDDPRFAGVMQMDWCFEAGAEDTLVTVICREVPPGIGAADHAEGLAASLAKLATHTESQPESVSR
jgi:uncharacterized protein YndB with AHSA1/START domain